MATTEFDPLIVAAPGVPLQPNPHDVQAKVPFAIESSSFIPRERYYSREFYELEKKHLWLRAWLMAARLEEIPYPWGLHRV
jgi:hypothetical protein